MDDVCELKSMKSPTERKILFNDISSDGRGLGMDVVEDGVADEVMAAKTAKSGGEGGRRSISAGIWQSPPFRASSAVEESVRSPQITTMNPLRIRIISFQAKLGIERAKLNFFVSEILFILLSSWYGISSSHLPPANLLHPPSLQNSRTRVQILPFITPQPPQDTLDQLQDLLPLSSGNLPNYHSAYYMNYFLPVPISHSNSIHLPKFPQVDYKTVPKADKTPEDSTLLRLQNEGTNYFVKERESSDDDYGRWSESRVSSVEGLIFF